MEKKADVSFYRYYFKSRQSQSINIWTTVGLCRNTQNLTPS